MRKAANTDQLSRREQVAVIVPSGIETSHKVSVFCWLLLQRGVFRAGLFENRDVGIRVFPENKEVLVGSSGLGRFA